MEEKKQEELFLSSVAKSIRASPIQELSHLAQKCNAINLAEGFTDFPAPSHIKHAAISAINYDFNQYRHTQGLCDHVAIMMKQMHGLEINPVTDVAICCGQTEAFAAAAFAIIDRGDEVILFDPCYETYEGCIKMAGGIPSFSGRTKAVVLNSPHNPTGKVFSKNELELIAGECRTRNCLAITDEVYEHVTFDNARHISLASFRGMQERTITSSLSKTFSVTGWRVGWAIAPPSIASAIRNIHVKVTDYAPAPSQEAALTALRSPLEYFESLRKDYESRRNYIIKLLERIGFEIHFKPQGAFFLFVKLPKNCSLSDIEFVKRLIQQVGVVAVPGCRFFHADSSVVKLCQGGYSYQDRYIRFAFCKSDPTLDSAAERLGELLDAAGYLKLQ